MARTYDNYANIITFSRSSSATYRAANGYIASASSDVPRIEYAADGSLEGILLEPQRTNFYANSTSLINSANSSCFVVSNTLIAPNETQTGDSIVEEDGFAFSRYIAETSITASTNADYCLSVFIKPGSRDRVMLNLQCPDGYITGSFYASNGTCYSNVASSNSTSIATGAINYSNGWKRLWISGTLQTIDVGTITFAGIGLLDDSGSSRYTGNSASAAIYAWGAQLEPGRYPSSLVYTDGAQATRALDYLSIPVDAFKYSSNSGTVVLEVSSSDYERYNNRLVNIGTSTSDGLDLWYTPSSTITVWNDQDNVRITDYVSVDRNEYNRIAMSYSANSNVGGLAVNGNTYAFGSNVPAIPSISSIRVSHEGSSDTSGITHIKNLSYYPRALSLEYIGELTR
jgi:hypothetical protein